MNKSDRNSIEQITIASVLFGACIIEILHSMGNDNFVGKLVVYGSFMSISVYYNWKHAKKLGYCSDTAIAIDN